MKPSRWITLVLILTYALFTQSASAQQGSAPPEVFAADTPTTTVTGHPFVVPAGWSMTTLGAARILSPPEAGSRLALVDATAPSADAAVAAAWGLVDPAARYPLAATSERPARDGWAEIRAYRYEHPTQAERRVVALAKRHGERWSVTLLDLARDVAEKRDAQIELLLGSHLPQGYRPETFAGRTAQPLAGPRLAALEEFVDRARRELGVPGVAVGVVQGGRVVLAKGFGVRAVGKADPVDAETLFPIASNTKPLTTLMLAKLVDAGRFTWETPVVQVMPSFRLGAAETTRRIQIQHLVCACTGLPRQDLEWIFEGERLTPTGVLEVLASMQPTSAFGELYQYSNLLAGAAGYVGAHAFAPGQELGTTYDRAMAELVFAPLGMAATTFDAERARLGNHATPHAQSLDGAIVAADWRLTDLGRASRPDGGAWSNVSDLLRYVQVELDRGRLPDGTRYLSEAALLARRKPQVARGKDLAYGMGLKIDHTAGTPMLHHGGNGFGFVSDVLWFPEHHVGAVILTNADGGGTSLRNVFRRRLLELLFDGEPQAEPRLAAFRKDLEAQRRSTRAQLTLPADPALAGKLASRYRSAELGELRAAREGAALWFDFGGWRSEMASRRDTDGSAWFVTVAPAASGFELQATESGELRALVLRDAQREYRFVEVP